MRRATPSAVPPVPQQQGAGGGDFRERYRDILEIIGELSYVHDRNLEIWTTHGKWVPGYLFFAEGLLVLLAIERFLRVILSDKASNGDTLPNLLEKATSTHLNLLTLPPFWTREQTIKAMKDVRNALMHGNYEQAAKQSGRQHPHDYFSSSTYTREVDTLYKILDGFCRQIDPKTGKPFNPRPPWQLR